MEQKIKKGWYDEYNDNVYYWQKVEKDFGGIEWRGGDIISHKFFDLKFNGDGCIWNNELIKSVKCIAKKKQKKINGLSFNYHL